MDHGLSFKNLALIFCLTVSSPVGQFVSTQPIEFLISWSYDDYALFMSLKSVYGGTYRDFPRAFKYKEMNLI